MVGPIRKRVFWLSVVACCFASVPLAVAGSCPDPGVRVFPQGTGAPTNTQVYVTFQADTVQVLDLEAGSSAVRSSAFLSVGKVGFALREQGGPAVKVSVRSLPKTTFPTFVLTAATGLKPGTEYAVILRDKTREFAVHYFRTGSGRDDVAPVFKGVKRARFHGPRAVKHWKDTSGPYATLWLDGPKKSRSAHQRLEIHALGKGKTPGDETLRSIVPLSGYPVVFGDVDSCRKTDFKFRADPGTSSGRRKGKPKPRMTIGVRVLDAAGHVSPMRTVSLQLD